MDSAQPTSLAWKWSQCVRKTHKPILSVLYAITGVSARNPRKTIASITIISLCVLVVGLSTRFSVETDENKLWAPQDSKSVVHLRWIEAESGFKEQTRHFNLMFHENGENLLGDRVRYNIDRVFDAVDVVRGLPDYHEICGEGCTLSGIVNFWNQSRDIMRSQVQSNDDAVEALSAEVFPNSMPVPASTIFGMAERDSSSNLLTKVQSFLVRIDFPKTAEAETFEGKALDAILDLRSTWSKEDDNKIRVEVIAERSFADEFTRAIVDDIPLVPLVFLIMSVFTCTVFFKWDKVRSRSLLGFSAVVSVLLSIMTGYGFMFMCGVPFSSATQILPFIVFGIGLDDVFVITGSYARLHSIDDPVERIKETINDVGVSITVTTITSTLAFALGCLSSSPAVIWLCLYACHTIVLVLLYQVTFFVACIVLDEQRMKQNRRDCCFCVSVNGGIHEQRISSHEEEVEESIADRIMHVYASLLLKPWTKMTVVVVFAILASLGAYSASKLKQEFRFTDVVPDDSYVTDFMISLSDFSTRSVVDPHVYFRFVDQSDPVIQAQMEKYIDDLIAIDAIETRPDFFWLPELKAFLSQQNDLAAAGFNEQVDAFLSVPVYARLFGNDVVRNATGSIIESRCVMRMTNVDMDDVKNQIKALKDQYTVTKSQPINQGRKHWSFFTYEKTYEIWEFYITAVSELILTTIIGVISVTLIATFFIPHWTAPVFVLPLVAVLYVNLLGFMQFAGITVNAVSYVTMVMSIGLLVDFIMHVLHRFYEVTGNRNEKTTKTLKTMGASIMLGAVSTFLGTLPLAFSSSEIFRTVFVAFFGVVFLGATHGLILLPVLLSLAGPVDCCPDHGDSSNNKEITAHDDVLAENVNDTNHNESPSSCAAVGKCSMQKSNNVSLGAFTTVRLQA